jgi:hypothetical protein
MSVTRATQTEAQPPVETAATAMPVDRLLVVANETLDGADLQRAILALVSGEARVLVIAPALVSRARYWTSDLGAGIDAARERLERSVAWLRSIGLHADGMIGDCNPELAIEDALRGFAAEHLLVSTHPPARSNWLERRVVQRARAHFGLPLTHIIVDAEH